MRSAASAGKATPLVHGELELGLRSIAVQIFDSSGRTLCTVNTGVQVARASCKRMLTEFLPWLLELQKTPSTILR
jgi:DNA-binding IclR family transcriptional regulator